MLQSDLCGLRTVLDGPIANDTVFNVDDYYWMIDIPGLGVESTVLSRLYRIE